MTMAGFAAQLATQVQAVAIGQHQVEHERVEVFRREAFTTGRQRAGGLDLEARVAKIVAHHGRQAGIVIDQQQASAHGMCGGRV